MRCFTVEDAARACGGKLCGSGDIQQGINEAVIDSRRVQPGDLFVAYKGDRVDGHDYIPVAFEKGAACCLAEREVGNTAGLLILVDDVQRAFEKIAAAYRDTLSIPVIGITGSVGKTTAKEMASAVLSQRFKVLKNEGNLNNQIGVPMTLSRIEREHELAVVEMGISGFGEMTVLASMARPTIALFTYIGHAHLEFLGDLDGVFRAKTELLPFMPGDGIVIANGDDEHLSKLKCAQRLILFGMGEDSQVRAENIRNTAEGTSCDIVYEDRCVRADIPAYGVHMVYAALEGAALGFVMGLSDGEIAAGIASYKTVGRRGAVLDTGYITLVDDCYNSNPDSLRCAMDSLMGLPGRHVCIISDMLEQGEEGESMHADMGLYAAEKGIDLLLSCGELSRHAAVKAGERGRWFESKAELITALPEYIREGDTVLVKASLGMHMEEVSEALKLLK